MPGPRTLLDSRRRDLSDSSAQFGAQTLDLSSCTGLIRMLQGRVDGSIAAFPRASQEDQQKLRDEIVIAKIDQIAIALAAVECSKNWLPDTKAVAETLPPARITDDALAIERLFHCAQLAADHTFVNDVIQTYAGQENTSEQQVLALMIAVDPTTGLYLEAREASRALHTSSVDQRNEEFRNFDASFSTHVHASNIATVTGLISRWSRLDAKQSEDGKLRYERTNLLNALVTSARQRAMENIAECRRKHVPCVWPIFCFETAEVTRDDPDEDNVNVLVQYWDASLQAKALLMLLSPADQASAAPSPH